MQNETTINTIFGVIQTLLHQIHQLWGRTTGANSQREKMAYRPIRSLRSPKLFAPAFTTGLRAMVFVTISGFLVLAKGQSATNCPPNSFPNTTNLAMNPSFEKIGPNGPFTTYQRPWPVAAPSAAAYWNVHSNNAQAKVTTSLEPTKVPAGTDPAGNPEGQKMIWVCT
jgi:hypothetical protein